MSQRMVNSTVTLVEQLSSALTAKASNISLSSFIYCFLGGTDNIDNVHNDHTSLVSDLVELYANLAENENEAEKLFNEIESVKKRVGALRDAVRDKFKQIIPDADIPTQLDDFDGWLHFKADQLSLLLLTQHELLQEAEKRRDMELVKLEPPMFAKEEKSKEENTGNEEEEINAGLEKWMADRLGTICFPEESHVILDTSTSRLNRRFPGSNAAISASRIRCLIKQPLDGRSSFHLDQLHPLGGSIETIRIAQLATKSGAPSLLVSHLNRNQLTREHQTL